MTNKKKKQTEEWYKLALQFKQWFKDEGMEDNFFTDMMAGRMASRIFEYFKI